MQRDMHRHNMPTAHAASGTLPSQPEADMLTGSERATTNMSPELPVGNHPPNRRVNDEELSPGEVHVTASRPEATYPGSTRVEPQTGPVVVPEESTDRVEAPQGKRDACHR